MALSMDEQRVLAEIERRLSAEDPSLAACMTNFRRPGPAAVLRSPRGRIIGSLFTVLLVAMISLMVYAMIPFRGHATRSPASPADVPPAANQISATGTGNPASQSGVTINANGGTSGKTATSTSATTNNVNASATGKTSTSGKASSPAAHSAKPQTTSSARPDQARAKTAGS